MTGRLTLGALLCVFLLGIALSLATYILLGMPVIKAVADEMPASQSLEVVLPCTDAIAEAGGVCGGTPVWEDPTMTRDGYEVIPSPAQAVGPTDPELGGPFLTREIPSPEQITCQEDDPCWDCRFDGNERCGVEIEGVWYVVQFRDGSPESVGYR